MTRENVFNQVVRADYEYLVDQFVEENDKEPTDKFCDELLTELLGYTFGQLINKVVNRGGLPLRAYSTVTNRWVNLERRGGKTPTGPCGNSDIVIFEAPKA